MQIRTETPQDAQAIARLTTMAFANHAHSDGSEPRIIAALRDTDALSLSLVAKIDGQLVGHLALSPVSWCDQHHWYGLGPISVSPELQNKGIGSALIHEALKHLRAIGAAGCVVLGEPDYYGRFGFKVSPRLTYPGVPEAYFMALALQPLPDQTGPVSYHPAFG